MYCQLSFENYPAPTSKFVFSISIASVLFLDQFPQPFSNEIRYFVSFSMSLHKCLNQWVTNCSLKHFPQRDGFHSHTIYVRMDHAFLSYPLLPAIPK